MEAPAQNPRREETRDLKGAEENLLGKRGLKAQKHLKKTRHNVSNWDRGGH